INLDLTSLSPVDLISFLMSSIKVSTSSSPTGLFSNARYRPSLNFCSLKGYRILFLDLITFGINNSADSKVVNLSPHAGHSLLLRVCDPSEINLESMTLVSVWLQKGQCIISF
ncbi:MAG: hypothetical protein MK238_09160, partial [Nitrospinales bacterium]|nr:hypothetical protein [Nitrospinales bacterium]